MNTGLGIDAGGSRSRWGLVGSDSAVIAQGSVAGFSALQMADEAGLQRVDDILTSLALEVSVHGRVRSVLAGVTGFGGMHEGTSQLLHALLAKHLRLAGDLVVLSSDIELACHAAFEACGGYLVYAGTGSSAGFVDDCGQFHRAGGRGGILDDGGGGYWIAIQALRQIWRAEDESPGCWVDSPMALALFKEIGGSDWLQTRRLIYGGSRGQIGQLARAVGAAAESDPSARAILQGAGHELARLGNAMIARFGLRPLALAGRVPELHPSIEQSMRESLLPGTDLRRVNLQTHIAAARLALRSPR